MGRKGPRATNGNGGAGPGRANGKGNGGTPNVNVNLNTGKMTQSPPQPKRRPGPKAKAKARSGGANRNQLVRSGHASGARWDAFRSQGIKVPSLWRIAPSTLINANDAMYIKFDSIAAGIDKAVVICSPSTSACWAWTNGVWSSTFGDFVDANKFSFDALATHLPDGSGDVDHGSIDELAHHYKRFPSFLGESNRPKELVIGRFSVRIRNITQSALNRGGDLTVIRIQAPVFPFWKTLGWGDPATLSESQRTLDEFCNTMMNRQGAMHYDTSRLPTGSWDCRPLDPMFMWHYQNWPQVTSGLARDYWDADVGRWNSYVDEGASEAIVFIFTTPVAGQEFMIQAASQYECRFDPAANLHLSNAATHRPVTDARSHNDSVSRSDLASLLGGGLGGPNGLVG